MIGQALAHYRIIEKLGEGYEVNVDLSKLRWPVSAKHSNPRLTR